MYGDVEKEGRQTIIFLIELAGSVFFFNTRSLLWSKLVEQNPGRCLHFDQYQYNLSGNYNISNAVKLVLFGFVATMLSWHL